MTSLYAAKSAKNVHCVKQFPEADGKLGKIPSRIACATAANKGHMRHNYHARNSEKRNQKRLRVETSDGLCEEAFHDSRLTTRRCSFIGSRSGIDVKCPEVQISVDENIEQTCARDTVFFGELYEAEDDVARTWCLVEHRGEFVALEDGGERRPGDTERGGDVYGPDVFVEVGPG